MAATPTVLHVLKNFRPVFTGVGVFLERLAPVWKEEAPHVEHHLLATETPRPAEADIPVAPSIQRIWYLQKGGAANWYMEVLLLWWLVRNLRHYQVIHFHTHVDRYFLAYLLAKLFGRRIILSATLDDSIPGLMRSYRPMFRALVGRLFRIFDAYVSLVPKLHDENVSMVAAGKAHLAPLGVAIPPDPKSDRAKTRAAYGIAEDDIVLIFVGGICARKDPLFLVEQLPDVLRFCPRAKLLIVGPVLEDDHHQLMLSFIQENGLEDRVIFTNEVLDPYPLFAMADIMTFGSHLEGFGAVVTEAMAHELPPVVRHLPGVNDSFVHQNETGFLFTKREEYLAALRRLIEDPALRVRIGTAARRLITARFDNRQNARRLLEIYGFHGGLARRPRILLISWYYPPANDVAALRVGKMAEYLNNSGWDVTVLTAKRTHLDMSLPVNMPSDMIVRTEWMDSNQLNLPWRLRAKGRNGRGKSGTQRATPLGDFFTNLVRIPDQQNGWIMYAIRAGRRIIKQHPVDVIYASGPPFSTFFVARALGRKFSVPWVAEYRDGWSRYVYAPKPEWRQAIDAHLEGRVSSTTAAVVAVSEPWAAFYRDRFRQPTIAIYNGFDPDSLPVRAPHRPVQGGQLSITYMGSLYGGLRDPSILYEAIKRSGLTPDDLQIRYYGPTAAEIFPLAEKLGVSDFVSLRARIPYRASLETQRQSDVLLLLQSPADPRNVPAKVFEYLALCRPILGLGLDDGIPARLIRDRSAGIYVSDPDAVAAQLKTWLEEKRKTGMIADLPLSVHAGLAQSVQFQRLSDFLHRIIDGTRAGSKTAS